MFDRLSQRSVKSYQYIDNDENQEERPVQETVR